MRVPKGPNGQKRAESVPCSFLPSQTNCMLKIDGLGRKPGKAGEGAPPRLRVSCSVPRPSVAA